MRAIGTLIARTVGRLSFAARSASTWASGSSQLPCMLPGLNEDLRGMQHLLRKRAIRVGNLTVRVVVEHRLWRVGALRFLDRGIHLDLGPEHWNVFRGRCADHIAIMAVD